MLTMKLYVDDIRKCPEGWQLARTNDRAIYFLHNCNVEEISIDHDICFYDRPKRILEPSDETFRPVAYYIAVMPAERRPKKITLHTANPWGAKELKAILNQVGIECEVSLSAPIYMDEVLGSNGN